MYEPAPVHHALPSGLMSESVLSSNLITLWTAYSQKRAFQLKEPSLERVEKGGWRAPGIEHYSIKNLGFVRIEPRY